MVPGMAEEDKDSKWRSSETQQSSKLFINAADRVSSSNSASPCRRVEPLRIADKQKVAVFLNVAEPDALDVYNSLQLNQEE